MAFQYIRIRSKLKSSGTEKIWCSLGKVFLNRSIEIRRQKMVRFTIRMVRFTVRFETSVRFSAVGSLSNGSKKPSPENTIFFSVPLAAVSSLSTYLRLSSRLFSVPVRSVPSLTRVQRFGRLRSFSAMASSKESPSNNPGLHAEVDEATKSYFLQQTMLRVKDPKVSLDFYSHVLGMSLLKRLDFPEMKFSLYFLGYENVASAPVDPVQRTVWTFGQKATLELTHNWGTESDPEFKGYHNGNSDPRGFGHIGITVDDVYKACARFESLGVEFAKKPDDGKMKGIAFIKDPDGYWIEIFDLSKIGGVTADAS